MNPIYIYAPNFVNWSAGIKVLYLLCKELNKIGIPTWIAVHGPVSDKLEFPVPILNQGIIDRHNENKLKSIAIYTESILGNPLNAAYTVRWILNYPGLLGGKLKFDDDFLLAYTQNLGSAVKKYDSARQIQILYIPALNMQEMSEASQVRENRYGRYSLIYAQKFRSLGGKINSTEGNTIEITRVDKKSTKRQETLGLIANAEQVLVYENTTVITEAQILGTPIRCIPNKWFNEIIAEKELGTSGIVWGMESKLEIPNSSEIINRINNFGENLPKTLQVLTNQWSLQANDKEFKNSKLPSNKLISKHSIMRIRALIQTKNLLTIFNFGWTYFRRWKNKHGN